MTYLTSKNETAIINAELKISQNCELPNAYGTLQWDIVAKAYNQNLWFIAKPPLDGWGNGKHFTQKQMMEGVDLTDIVESEKEDDWFAPVVPINGDGEYFFSD